MEVFKQNDRLVINSIQANEENTYFKISNNINVKVEINIFDADSNLLIETIYENLYDVSNSYILFNDKNQQIIIDTEQYLRSKNYNTGSYNVTYKFYVDILGSNDESNNVILHKVSASRKEISIKYVGSNENVLSQLIQFGDKYFYQFGQEFAFTKYANFGKNYLGLILNGKNEFDPTTNLHTLILKLYSAISNDYIENAPLWIVELYSDEVTDNVVLLPGLGNMFDGVNILSSPNFQSIKDNLYKAYDASQSEQDLLQDSIKYGDLYEPYLSATSNSYLYGIDLNVDYSNFSNFVHFGSAAQIVDNFKKKVELLQYYETQSLYRTSSYADSSSLYNKTKKSQIIKEFTRYEKFLYFSTGSYFTSSLEDDGTGNISPYNNFCYGDGTNLIISSTWPKTGTISGSGFPYVLASPSNVTASAWVELMIRAGLQYDSDNRDYLLNTVPEYIRTDVDSNSDYISFINMIGEFYDNIWVYINSYYSLLKRDNKLSDTLPNELIWDVLKNHGFDINNSHDTVDLGKYIYGLYPSGSNSNYTVEIKKAQKDISLEIWNRLLNNIPFIFKSKGTKKSILALLNCYGVPRDLITIREFGGTYESANSGSYLPNYSQKYEFVIEDFTHAIDFAGNQYVSIPWTGSVSPDTIELKFKTTNTSAETMSIFTKKSGNNNNFDLKLYKYTNTSQNDLGYLKLEFQSSSHESAQSSPFHFYNGDFYNVFIKREFSTDSTAIQTYTLYVKKFDEDTARLIIDNSSSFTAQGNNPCWYTSGSLELASGSNMFIGSMDEFRLWTEPLDRGVINWHTQYWGATNGNYFTSSISTLQFRLSFNVAKNLGTVGSFLENEAYVTSSNTISASVYGFSNIATYPYNYSAYERTSLAENNFTSPSSINSQKIRVEENYISQSIMLEDGYVVNPLRLPANSEYQNLIYDKSINKFVPIIGEQSSLKFSDVDSDKLLIGFAPAQLINNSMIAFYGNTNLLSTIGDYENIYKDYYPNSDFLNDFYWKYAKDGITFFEYINYIRMYDKNMFEQIEKAVPAQSSTMFGTVYEETMIRRNKIRLINKELAENYDYGTANPISGYINPSFQANNLYIENKIVLNPVKGVFGNNISNFEIPIAINTKLIDSKLFILPQVNLTFSPQLQFDNVKINTTNILVQNVTSAIKIRDLTKNIQLDILNEVEAVLGPKDFLFGLGENDNLKVKYSDNASIQLDSDNEVAIEILNIPNSTISKQYIGLISNSIRLPQVTYNKYAGIIEFKLNKWNFKWPGVLSVNKNTKYRKWKDYGTISTSKDTPDRGAVVVLTISSNPNLTVNYNNNPQLII